MTYKQIIIRARQIDNKLFKLRLEIDKLLEEIYLKNDTTYDELERTLIDLRNFDLEDAIYNCREE